MLQQTKRVSIGKMLPATILCLAVVFIVQSLTPLEVMAQAKNSSLFLCRVVDKASDKPMIVDYKIINSSGENVLKGKTTVKEGLIKAVVDQGETYTIKFSSVEILSSEDTVHIQNNGEYYIAERKLKVTLAKAGNVLMSADIFGNGATITEAGKRQLDKAAELMMSNRNLYAQLSVGKGGAGSTQQISVVKEYMKSKGRLVSRRLKVVAAAASQKDAAVLTVSKVVDPFN